MRAAIFALLLCGLTAGADAQPASGPIERVIVTAPRYHAGVAPNAIAHDFVGSFAVPSVLTEQISRWEVAVCPQFLGVAPQFAAAMEAHFRTIADQAGAPIKPTGCKANLSVVVTRKPQEYLDALREKNSGVVGYKGVKSVSHPVQAWYVTGTRDIRGQVFIDQDRQLALEGCVPGDPTPCQLASSNTALETNVGGWRGRNEDSSDLLYVTIIVDAAATARYQVGEMADYVAMLALSRTEDYGDCQLMPSITNLMTPNCDDKLKPSQITPTDIAYLRGVYKMDPGAKLLIQQDQIAAEMAASLGAGK